jgi:hypothetical protein
LVHLRGKGCVRSSGFCAPWPRFGVVPYRNNADYLKGGR